MNPSILRDKALAALVVVTCLSAPVVANAQATSDDAGACGPMVTNDRVDPHDYRDRTNNANLLRIVEHGHFPPSVETLTKPVFSFGADIDYTLWAFPNHARALATLVRLGAREKTAQPAGSRFTIDCYFQRALHFRADDLIVRIMYASYLGSQGRVAAAVAQLKYASSQAEADDGFAHYNIGLTYLKMKQYDLALAEAHIAMRLGFSRPELQQGLEAAGHWQAPAATGAASAPTAASAASAP